MASKEDENNPLNPNKSPFSQPQATKFFFGGVDTDTSKELLGTDNTGKSYDMFNTRVNDTVAGTDQGAKTIRGEEELYVSQADGYRCIGSFNVGNKLVEIWAPYDPADGGIIRIDGDVVCQSVNFNIDPDFPLEWDTNDDALGGEFYITDDRIKPLYFSVKDILDNFGFTQKYFADFNINNYIISLELPPDNIIYDRNPLVTIGGGGGIRTGQHSYSHRYVTTSGEATNWSVPTPLIFVPSNLQSVNPSEPYTSLKTIGQDTDSDPKIRTDYGVKILFRINNTNNYDFIEIRRTSYENGEAIDFVPLSYIIKRIPVSPGQFQIYEYVDSQVNESDELVLSQSTNTNTLSEIKRCKAIRYFYNKVVLGNIEYESRDVNNQVTFLTSANNNEMCPIMESIGQQGYKDAYNHAYKRMFMHGERYGFSVVFWDSNFSRSLAVPVPNFGNFLMPNKREYLGSVLSGDPLTYSKASSKQADTIGGVRQTFEVVDYKLGRQRVPFTTEGQTEGRNILAKGGAGARKDKVKADTVGYRPFTPVRPYDFDSNEQYTPVEKCGDGGEGIIGDAPGNDVVYNPWIYNPEYLALGMCLIGIDQMPSWATAFSVVRTRKAGRVIAQGMAFWHMKNASIWKNNGRKGTGQKDQNKISVHFPDAENGVVPSSVIDDLRNNPSSFQLQMVEPLGFNSEVFHFRSNLTNNPITVPFADGNLHSDTQIDMVIHASCQAEIGSDTVLGTRRVVDGEPATNIGTPDPANPDTGYVQFGKWRNPVAPTIKGNSFAFAGNTIFNIKSCAVDTQNEENKTFLVLELCDENGVTINLYNQGGGLNDTGDFADAATKDFTEPIYIVNLIRDGVTVGSLDFQQYLQAANYVKVRSIIGVGTGLPGQQYKLCGERPEDVAKTNFIDRYIWVEMNNNQEFFRWINISFLTPAQVAVINADIANGTTNYNGLLLYGTYEAPQLVNTVVRFTNPLHSPEQDARIEVRYDNRFPVYFHGGDTTCGYANFPIVHRTNGSSTGNGDTNGWGTFLRWNRAMPYRWFKLKENYYITRDSKPPFLPIIQNGGDSIADRPLLHGTDWCKISAIRQMVVLYTCQSYSHLPLSYLNYYPVVNYKMRPTAWDNSKSVADQHIYAAYETDYPKEIDRWQLGGLQIDQFSPNPFNLDYSKENVADVYEYVTQLLFVENTLFYNRIAWSNTRPIQKILAPNLKTFAPFNVFDISDNRGQIQRLYAFKHSGENLYAFCEDDICTVLTRKRTLSDLAGNALGVTGNGADTAFIQEQIWMNETKKGALQGQFYLGFAECGDKAFFANHNGVFLFSGENGSSQLTEITKGYYNQLYKSLFSRAQREDVKFLNQYMHSVYNVKDKELWMYFDADFFNTTVVSSPSLVLFEDIFFNTKVPNWTLTKNILGASARFTLPSPLVLTTIVYRIIDNTGEGIQVSDDLGNVLFTGNNGDYWKVSYNPYSVSKWSAKQIDGELNENRNKFVFVYSDTPEKQKWIGIFGYDFESFTSFDNKIYGHRNDGGAIKTYTLDAGFRINGDNIKGRIWSIFNPQVQQSYLFNRFRINSNIKPSNLKLYNVKDLDLSIAEIADVKMNDYNAFENWLSRNKNAPNVKNQGTHLIVQIESTTVDEDFFVNSISFEYNKVR